VKEKAPAAKATATPAPARGEATKAPAAPERSEEKKPPAAPKETAPARPAERDGGNGAPLTVPDDWPGRLVPASPATRLLARELGVDIARVKGTAKNGRVTPDDVKNFVRQLARAPLSPASPAAAPRLPDFSKWGPVEAQSLSGIRQETARQMALAWAVIPHVTQHDQADITDLEAFRRAQPDSGPKITMTAFALKAAAIALREFPQFNASLDLANQRLILKRYYHLGVAVDTERGLLVPVLRDVDKKSIYQLATELTEVAGRARQRKLSGDDLSGGTFTITNLGGIGGTGFTPIVNFPEVAILGLSRSRLTPVVYQGAVAPRLILPLSLSYDHRVIDGADAARFTRRLAEMLENPLVMLLRA
jgi:pyruvate dehydrogenase E2 component (dihydrolipoamide acetyltransferase)